MKTKERCDEPGCTDAGAWHPFSDDDWVSPKLYCRKHRVGKATVFLERHQAIRRFGAGWWLRATETRPTS